ncbi:hypothetical protein E2562_021748 [Oryza meyeriana var. granulata]|uniref:Uncharacterized protein n=1 Tax=Oryza meyeriana var. granulata TaxID=110450 RepID=A0A6G1EXY0_9ORYZ|nr:hypothetical protein E2562_021748 [Oryza meyeriana var. granulata]
MDRDDPNGARHFHAQLVLVDGSPKLVKGSSAHNRVAHVGEFDYIEDDCLRACSDAPAETDQELNLAQGLYQVPVEAFQGLLGPRQPAAGDSHLVKGRREEDVYGAASVDQYAAYVGLRHMRRDYYGIIVGVEMTTAILRREHQRYPSPGRSLWAAGRELTPYEKLRAENIMRNN